MKKQTDVPLIFNLFPRHYRAIDSWAEAIPHAKRMAFNAIFVNPFHETGFSGSLYAVKDYYRLNPVFLKAGEDPSDFAPLKRFIEAAAKAGIEIIMDLVVNHTAFDSVLTVQHPSWYKRDKKGKLISPYAIDPAEAGNVTVWGDLAIIDNGESSDRQALWDYWDSMVGFYQDLGIYGFRCDAAYQVPAPLWTQLISSAKSRYPQTMFYAETLGCQISEIEALSKVGFDYLFNSSKWWNFDKPWALEQHDQNRHIAPSIGFPESHDTERLASLSPGTIEMQKCRYAFAALFSRGLLMPMGYEYGAKTRMDVVRGTPDDVDRPQWDLTSWVKDINSLKLRIPVLGEEGQWRALNEYNLLFLFLEKASQAGNKPAYVCINKKQSSETAVDEYLVPPEIKKCGKVIQLTASPDKEEDVPEAFSLDPADVVLFLP